MVAGIEAVARAVDVAAQDPAGALDRVPETMGAIWP